jgi:hypothetical protein
MRNVAPSRSLERRSRRLLEIAFVVVAAGIFTAVFGLAFYVVPLTSNSSDSFGLFNAFRGVLFVGGVLLGLSGIGLAVRALFMKTENPLAKPVGAELGQHLGEGFTFIRNISKRKLGYIDAALVGTPGVLIFRILDWDGSYLNERGNWLKANIQGEWKPLLTSNPTQDTIDDVQSLRTYLAKRDLPDIPIFGVVVFLNDDPVLRLTLKEPVVPATHLTSLYSRLQSNYLAKDRIDPKAVTAIIRLLWDG